MSKKRPSKRDKYYGRPSDRVKGKKGSSKNTAKKPKPTSGEQVEGRQAVRELLIAGARNTIEIFMAEDMKESEILTDIEELALSQGVPVRTVSAKRVASEALTTSHQGVVAKADPLKLADLDDLMANPNAFLIVLDGVTDPMNLGSILRISECSGVTGIVIAARRSVSITASAAKTAAGALEHVPICIVGGIPAALSQMSGANITTIGLDMAGKHGIFDSSQSLDKPLALVLGKEGSGLSRLVMERVDRLVSIPLLGELNSLNVATACAVATFEVVRRQQDIDRSGIHRD